MQVEGGKNVIELGPMKKEAFGRMSKQIDNDDEVILLEYHKSFSMLFFSFSLSLSLYFSLIEYLRIVRLL